MLQPTNLGSTLLLWLSPHCYKYSFSNKSFSAFDFSSQSHHEKASRIQSAHMAWNDSSWSLDTTFSSPGPPSLLRDVYLGKPFSTRIRLRNILYTSIYYCITHMIYAYQYVPSWAHSHSVQKNMVFLIGYRLLNSGNPLTSTKSTALQKIGFGQNNKRNGETNI